MHYVLFFNESLNPIYLSKNNIQSWTTLDWHIPPQWNVLNCSHFRRRTLKNRGYAASCRIKRLEQKDELESEKGKEFEDLDKMQVEIQVTTISY